MRDFKESYGHVWPLIFGVIYLIWFIILENVTFPEYHIIHCVLDDYIPFCEFFIVFYFSWFVYIPSIFIFLFFKSKEEFYRLCAYMFSGMLFALFICTVYPNAQTLRMQSLDNNVFSSLIKFIYTADTDANVFPSVHVFNSICAHICLVKSAYIRKGHPIKAVSLIWSVLICLSTVFVKQHSTVDLIGGLVMAVVLYFVMFKGFFKKMNSSSLNT